MLAPNSDCKKNYNTMHALSNQLYVLTVEAGNMTMNLKSLQDALTANVDQIQNLKTYYYNYTSNLIPPDMSYITNSNIACIEKAENTCDVTNSEWVSMVSI